MERSNTDRCQRRKLYRTLLRSWRIGCLEELVSSMESCRPVACRRRRLVVATYRSVVTKVGVLVLYQALVRFWIAITVLDIVMGRQ